MFARSNQRHARGPCNGREGLLRPAGRLVVARHDDLGRSLIDEPPRRAFGASVVGRDQHIAIDRPMSAQDRRERVFLDVAGEEHLPAVDAQSKNQAGVVGRGRRVEAGPQHRHCAHRHRTASPHTASPNTGSPHAGRAAQARQVDLASLRGEGERGSVRATHGFDLLIRPLLVPREVFADRQLSHGKPPHQRLGRGEMVKIAMGQDQPIDTGDATVPQERFDGGAIDVGLCR